MSPELQGTTKQTNKQKTLMYPAIHFLLHVSKCASQMVYPMDWLSAQLQYSKHNLRFLGI